MRLQNVMMQGFHFWSHILNTFWSHILSTFWSHILSTLGSNILSTFWSHILNTLVSNILSTFWSHISPGVVEQHHLSFQFWSRVFCSTIFCNFFSFWSHILKHIYTSCCGTMQLLIRSQFFIHSVPHFEECSLGLKPTPTTPFILCIDIQIPSRSYYFMHSLLLTQPQRVWLQGFLFGFVIQPHW